MTTSPLRSAATSPPRSADGVAPARPTDDGAVEAQLERLRAAFESGDGTKHQYLLLLRFAAVNLIGFALLGGAYWQGWFGVVVAADSTGLSIAIFAAFLMGLVICTRKVWQASVELNRAKAVDRRLDARVGRYLAEVGGRAADSRALSASALRLKLFSRIAVVRQTANTLVVLGLIGTVVGFIMALSGVRPEAAGDPSAIGPMVSTLIAGMAVALYTTLVGAVFNVWLTIAYHVLATGTVNMFTAIIAVGERDAAA